MQKTHLIALRAGAKYARMERCRLFFFFPASVAPVILMLAACLIGCKPDDVPPSHVYKGKLSAQYPNQVIEVYRSIDGKFSIGSALIDVSGDGIPDRLIEIRDGQIVSVSGVNSAKYSAASYTNLDSPSRPQSAQPPPALIEFVAATKSPPDEAALDALYAETPQQPHQSWLLAERLRNATGAAFVEGVHARVKFYFEREKLPEQSAFILSGLGEKGIATLGEILRSKKNTPIAAFASAALRDSPASVSAAIEDMLALLADPTTSQGIQQDIFLSLEAELMRNPVSFFESWWKTSPALRERVNKHAHDRTAPTAAAKEELDEIVKHDVSPKIATAGGPSLLIRLHEIANKRMAAARKNPNPISTELTEAEWFANCVKKLNLMAAELRISSVTTTPPPTTKPTTTNSLP
ncbi:MAG: hypothetical protein LBS59_06710 [Puniceicoccales bacterium]|jgi:hypothetical protein|nr:hypothetical protein [Puniceicoccales bacterium]